MKILHVETGRHLYGGPQQVVYLASELIARGHDCTLICPPGSAIDTAARQAAIPVRNLFCAGDLDLPFAYRLSQYLKESRPDIVHCHSRRGADMLGGLAASYADVPAVVSRRVDNTEMRLVAALRYRPFQRVIAISNAIAAILRESGVDDQKLVVIHSAVDTEQFARVPDCDAFRREFELPADAIVLAAAGQLIPRKGHRFLIEAMRSIRAARPEIRCLIFGEGELDALLREEVASQQLGDVVRFCGFRNDLDDFVGCFDLFVHPALAEGLGVAALKASAAGVPVVGFRAGGLVEAVADGETGILVPPQDSEALAQAILELLSDGALRRRLAAAGRERMRREFSIDAMVNRHIELYESVLNE